MNSGGKKESSAYRPQIVVAPLKVPFGDVAESIFECVRKRFKNVSCVDISSVGPITTLDFGEDGLVEAIFQQKPVPSEFLEQHPSVPDLIADYPYHLTLIAKSNGHKPMDRIIAGLNLMVAGWGLLTEGHAPVAYWAASDQWAGKEQWDALTTPAAEKFELPKALWAKVTVERKGAGAVLRTVGLSSLVGFEYVWRVEGAIDAALKSLDGLIGYTIDPSTPIPRVGQTFGNSTIPEFTFRAAQDGEFPYLEIEPAVHGLVH